MIPRLRAPDPSPATPVPRSSFGGQEKSARASGGCPRLINDRGMEGVIQVRPGNSLWEILNGGMMLVKPVDVEQIYLNTACVSLFSDGAICTKI